MKLGSTTLKKNYKTGKVEIVKDSIKDVRKNLKELKKVAWFIL